MAIKVKVSDSQRAAVAVMLLNKGRRFYVSDFHKATINALISKGVCERDKIKRVWISKAVLDGTVVLDV